MDVAWLGLADGYVVAGDMDTAAKYYDKTSGYGQLNEDTYYKLANYFIDKGDYDSAYPHIWWFNKNSKSSFEGLRLLGEYYGAKGDYVEAEKQLLAYLAKVPDSAEGLYTLGKVYFMANDNGRAKEFYLKAVKTGDNSPELFFGLTCLESEAGNVEQALAYLKMALQYGYADRQQLYGINYLAKVRHDPRFRLIVSQYLKD